MQEIQEMIDYNYTMSLVMKDVTVSMIPLEFPLSLSMFKIEVMGLCKIIPASDF